MHSLWPALQRLIRCIAVGVCFCLHSWAQPADASPARYVLWSCAVEVADPVEVSRAKGHLWFPTLHAVEGPELLCEAVLADDKAQGRWPAALCLSRDGGASWRRIRDIESYGPASMPLGNRRVLILPYETWPIAPEDKRNAHADGTIVALGEDGSAATENAPVVYRSFPRDLADYHVGEVYLLNNGNILSLKDGRLFTTVYGKFTGDAKDSVWSMTSEDGGHTWQFQTVVANGPDMANATEGANESNTARLADGRLLCVFRTGGDYHKSYSSDEGATWCHPVRMEGVFSVEPQLVRLENGALVLSGGRPGLFVWVCTDGEGAKWERINLAEHHNLHVRDKGLHYTDAFCRAEGVDPPQSTSYTGMLAVGPDEALVCYDRLGNGWQGAPGPWGEEDAVFCVRLRVVPLSPR